MQQISFTETHAPCPLLNEKRLLNTVPLSFEKTSVGIKLDWINSKQSENIWSPCTSSAEPLALSHALLQNGEFTGSSTWEAAPTQDHVSPVCTGMPIPESGKSRSRAVSSPSADFLQWQRGHSPLQLCSTEVSLLVSQKSLPGMCLNRLSGTAPGRPAGQQTFAPGDFERGQKRLLLSGF